MGYYEYENPVPEISSISDLRGVCERFCAKEFDVTKRMYTHSGAKQLAEAISMFQIINKEFLGSTVKKQLDKLLGKEEGWLEARRRFTIWFEYDADGVNTELEYIFNSRNKAKQAYSQIERISDDYPYYGWDQGMSTLCH